MNLEETSLALALAKMMMRISSIKRTNKKNPSMFLDHSMKEHWCCCCQYGASFNKCLWGLLPAKPSEWKFLLQEVWDEVKDDWTSSTREPSNCADFMLKCSFHSESKNQICILVLLSCFILIYQNVPKHKNTTEPSFKQLSIRPFSTSASSWVQDPGNKRLYAKQLIR